MTPQERQMVDDLFDRLARLETGPREADAEAAIMAGLRRAPNATYALVQTVLLQDEALRQAHDRIAELEGRTPAQAEPGFLDSMRNALGFDAAPNRGSVPRVPPADSGRPAWNTGQVLGGAPNAPANGPAGGGYADPRVAGAPGGGGSSFLGTAAATAAGVIGGSMLMNSLRGLTGGGQQHGFGDVANSDKASPWGGGNDASGGNLARDAGVGDIGKSGSDQRQSFADQNTDQSGTNDSYDTASNDYGDDDDDDGDFDDGDFDGGSDYA
ncbi:MAG: DUF2076 domain-containing protein [Afipia sp.]|nr:DUF2076 domain-containing protein [Afipia sp.]OJW65607.1 MAG: ABC transporter substrate-binding protein [Afipia sp. 64-13]